MPIYEFACPKCRRIFNFLSKRVNPERLPVCPKCGNKKMVRQMSPFAMPKGAKEPVPGGSPDEAGMPNMDDPRGVLNGEGVTKYARWVTFVPGDEIDEALLTELILEAARTAVLPKGIGRL